MICYVLAMGKQHLGPHVVVGYGIKIFWPGLFITSPDHLVVICIWWVDDCFVINEDFIGMHHLERTTADQVVAILKNVLLRMNLNIQRARHGGTLHYAGEIRIRCTKVRFTVLLNLKTPSGLLFVFLWTQHILKTELSNCVTMIVWFPWPVIVAFFNSSGIAAEGNFKCVSRVKTPFSNFLRLIVGRGLSFFIQNNELITYSDGYRCTALRSLGKGKRRLKFILRTPWLAIFFFRFFVAAFRRPHPHSPQPSWLTS